MDNIDQSFNNVVEFRHSGWWNPDVIKLLKAHNVAFCTVSGLKMPTDVVVSANFGYFRFHGPDTAYASKYTNEQLNIWAECIADKVNENKLNEIYCYFNNDYFGYAIENAKLFNQLLTEKIKQT